VEEKSGHDSATIEKQSANKNYGNVPATPDVATVEHETSQVQTKEKSP
jgi:hypothetical protein